MLDQSIAENAGTSERSVVVKSEPFWRRQRYALILLAILGFAAIFRFTGTNFDRNTFQHPDERFIVGRTIFVKWPGVGESIFDARNSTLNTRSIRADINCPPNGCEYPYGSLPVYISRAAGWALDSILPPDVGRPKGYYLNDFAGVTLLGRHLSALFDLITVLLVFMIGRRLYSSAAGLVAAALVGFAVTHIQIAHFFASDSFLVTFMMAAVYFSVRLMQRPTIWAALGAGAFVGLAIASKVTILPFALIVVAAVVLRATYRKRTRILGAEFGEPTGLRPASKSERERSLGAHLMGGAGYLLVAGVASVLAFAATEPYVLWSFNWSLFGQNGFDNFLRSNPWGNRILSEGEVQAGRADVPYTRQYVGTRPLLYHLENMVMWGLGPVPGVITVVGFAVGLFMALKRRPAEILLMAGAVPYFLTILTLESKWMRYMLPLVPIFCLLGAAFLVRGIEWQSRRSPQAVTRTVRGWRFQWLQRNLFRVLTGVTVGAAFLWAVSFMSIYTQEHSRIQASRWIAANVPDGSSKNTEGWDDSLPVGVPGAPAYTNLDFAIYDYRPPEDVFLYLKERLAQTDYVFLASNRLYDSVDNMPWAYPVQIKYYDLLFKEKLGFVKVHTSHVTPSLLGIRFDDQGADESFTVYDHPRVDVFKKVTQLTDEQMRSLFSSALNAANEYIPNRHGKVTTDKSLMYSEGVSGLPDTGDYAWNPLAQENTQWIGVLLWLLVAQVIGLLALPIVFAVFRNLPDRGYAFAKLVGLLLVSWGAWMLASVRLAPFTVWSILLVLAVMTVLSALCWRLGAGEGMRHFWAKQRGLILFYELLFFVAFAAFLYIRLLNPDIWQPFNGGEKPMEFGYLNSILRSPWMPPADPFFSDGYVNYYYHGMFVMACLIKLVGADPSVAFNYAIPLLYALTFVAAASVVYNIVAWSQRRRGSTHPVSRSGLVFGALASVLMVVIGNMHAFWQWLMIQFPTQAGDLVRWASSMGFTEGSILGESTRRTFDFWGPSRILTGTINEFPFWAFLFADFHPHLINMPFTLLAVGLAINLALTRPFGAARTQLVETAHADWVERGRVWITSSLGWLWGNGWTGVLTFAVTTLTLGGLIVINSWDFPTYLALIGGAVLIAVLRLRSHADDDDEAEEPVAATAPAGLTAGPRWSVYLASITSLGALAGISLLLYLPFFLNFKAFFTQIYPLVDGGIIPGTTDRMYRTHLPEFLVIWLIFMVVAASYLLACLIRYPWGNAFGEIARLLGDRNKPTVANTVSPQYAFKRRPALSLIPRRRLTLAANGPSFGDTGVTLAYRLHEDSGPVATGPVREGTNGHSTHEPQEVPTEPAPQGNGWEAEYGAASDGGMRDGGVTTIEARPHVTVAPEPLPNRRLGTFDVPVTGNGHTEETLPSFGMSEVEPILTPVPTREAAPIPEQRGVIPAAAGVGMLAVTAALVLLQLATGQLLLAVLIGLIGGITATSLGGSRSAASLITAMLFVGALAVAMGVELVWLADHNARGGFYRMNTVFKFYIQVWVLFALASAAGTYFLLYGVRDRLARKRLAQTTTEDGSSNIAVVEEKSAIQPIAPLPARVRDTVSYPVLSTPTNWLTWSDTEPLVPAAVEDVPHQPALSVIEEPVRDFQVEKPAALAVPASLKTGPQWTWGRLAWLSLFGLLLVMSLAYPILGTPARLADRFGDRPAPIGSLNGLNFMTTGRYGTDAVAGQPVQLKYDYEAINWLKRNVSGLKVVAERSLGYYREYGMRVSSNTGLPMLAGGLHQEEQRYDWMVGERRGEANQIFTTSDVQTALNLINKYDISYIYAGQLERGLPGYEGDKFEQMADPKVGILRKVYEAQVPEGVLGTTIYEVIRETKTIAGAPVEGSGVPGISITPVPTRVPTPLPTPPVDDPTLKALIAEVATEPGNQDKRRALIEWYRNNNYPGEAARELETLVKQAPTDIANRHQLGDAYQAAGLLDRALKAWEDARDVDPGNPAGQNKVGIAYLERRRYDEAVTAFRAAVEGDKNFVESWFFLGEAYLAKGDRDNARQAFQGVLDNSRDPNSWQENARQKLEQLK